MRTSGQWLLGVVVGAVVLGMGVGTPAQADPTYDQWKLHFEAVGSTPASDIDLPGGVGVTGDRQHVRLSKNDNWLADFSAPAGRHLDAGETFLGTAQTVGSTATAGLKIQESLTYCGLTQWDTSTYGDPWLSIGTFTVQQASYDANGHVTSFAVTFEQNCRDVTQPVIRGSLASGAIAPPGDVPPPTPSPGPVSGLAVTNAGGYGGLAYTNTTRLTWHNPSAGPAYKETDVAYVGCDQFAFDSQCQLYRGTGTTFVTALDGIQTSDFAVYGISPLGRAGPISTIRVTGTRMSLDVSRGTITMGGTTTLTGWLAESLDICDPVEGCIGPRLAGRTLSIYSKPLHAPWSSFAYLGRVTTGRDGSYSFVDSPEENTAYEVRWKGSPQYLGNSTYAEAVGTDVAPRVDLVAARHQARRNAKVTFTTARSTVGSRSVVYLQRYDGHRWTTVATKRITQHAGGRVSKRVKIRFRPRTSGGQAFRLVKPGDSRHVNGVSRTVRVKVR